MTAAFAERVRWMLARADSVGLLAGHLAVRAGLAGDIADLAETTGIPVAALVSVKDIVDESHPLSASVYWGAHGDKSARIAVEDSDLLVLVGAMLADTTTGRFSHRIYQTRTISLGLRYADIAGEQFDGIPLRQALAVVRDMAAAEAERRSAPLGRRPEPRSGRAPARAWDARSPITQELLWHLLPQWLEPHHTLTAETGTAYWGAVESRLPDDTVFIGQPLWCSIGYTLPAALGAALADRSRRPVLVIGDGALQMTVQELATIAAQGLDAVVVVLDNAGYTIEHGVPVPLRSDGRVDLGAMARAVTARTRAVLLVSPTNPTGTVLHREELDCFLTDVPSDVLVVLDEAYREFVRDPGAADGLDAQRAHPNVCVLRTFSKAYGLSGLCVGYAVAHEQVARAVGRAAVPGLLSAVAQAAALASLAAADELRARIDTIVSERERLRQELARQGWSPSPSEANFVWFALGEDTPRFATACEEAGLAVRAFPGEGVRVTVGEREASDLLLAVARGLVDERTGMTGQPPSMPGTR
ncbi:aminotransferase class I/II-fold pyridoxal phosphate-dependent enzyme [Streptomyces sp. NPDC085946]|uniref:aminotransferase class I/II-fold pyridoxal phosphate-dependent enzyme n=1 Tax=Streptomyces sp. NPDC085946 TaxID=3365744 RepID=UPI0037D3C528